ncbi:MAG: ATP-binding protein [Cyanobacteriota bacterium]|nr:ATP-binding protein [Cyanobacteriota bacterium]
MITFSAWISRWFPFFRLRRWQRERRTLEALGSLSYRAGNLSEYLAAVASGVSQLLEVDWSVVTFVKDGLERVLASNLEGEDLDCAFDVHGSLTNTVFETGETLVVRNALDHPEYGEPPEGYCAYLGIPLRTSYSEIIGTICSFHRQEREFSPEEVGIAELFAERAATAIDNYHLYQQQREFNEALEAEVLVRSAELQMAQEKNMEQERLAAIGQFATMIVHEIRNPLSTISLTLNYFQRLPIPQPAQERLSLAQAEQERLERLLNDILTYSRLQVLRPSLLELNTFIEEQITIFRLSFDMNQYTINYMPWADKVWVKADADRLKQVVINLLRNACEAVAKGDPIRCSLLKDSQRQQACIEIHNRGSVIPAHLLSRVTDLFYTTKPAGTGLGLPIVKQIVEAHGGELSIRSSEVDGTTVRVYLALAHPPIP